MNGRATYFATIELLKVVETGGRGADCIRICVYIPIKFISSFLPTVFLRYHPGS
jgi:hypothetical protein